MNRQHELMTLLMAGKSRTDCALEMNLSYSAVDATQGLIMRRLNVRGVKNAVKAVHDKRLLMPNGKLVPWFGRQLVLCMPKLRKK